MKRKLLSMLLVLCMVVSLLPMSAFAAEISETGVTSLKVGDTTIAEVTGTGTESAAYKATAYVSDYSDVKLSITLTGKTGAKLYYKASDSETITAEQITTEITMTSGSATDAAISGLSDSNKYLLLKLDMEGSSSEYKYFVITVEKYATGAVAATLEGTLTQNTAVSGAKIKLTATTLQFVEEPKKDDFVLEGTGSAGLQIDDSITRSDATNVELTLTGTPTASGDVTVKIKQAAFEPQPKDEVTATGSIQVAAEAKAVTLTADPSEVTAGAAVSQITLTAENGTFATASDNTSGNFAIDGDRKGTLAITGVNASSTTATLTLSGDAGSAGTFTIKVKKEAFEPNAAEDVTVTITVAAAKEAAKLTVTPATLYTEQSDAAFNLTLENATFVQDQVNTTNVTLEEATAQSGLSLQSATYTDETHINVKLSGSASQAGTIKIKVAQAAISGADAAIEVSITVSAESQPTAMPQIKGEEATVMCNEGNASATIELSGDKYEGDTVTVTVYNAAGANKVENPTATYNKDANTITLNFDPALSAETTYQIAVKDGDKAESEKVTVKVEPYKAQEQTAKPEAEGGFTVIVCEDGNETATVTVSNSDKYESDVTVTLYDKDGENKIEEGVDAIYSAGTLTLSFDPALEAVTKYQVAFTESEKSESEKVEIEVMPLTPAAEASQTEVTATDGNTKAEIELSNENDYTSPAEATVAVKVYASEEDATAGTPVVQGVDAAYADGKITLTFKPALAKDATYYLAMVLTQKDGQAWAQSSTLQVQVKYVQQTPTPVFNGPEEVEVTCDTATTAQIPLKNGGMYKGDTVTVTVYKDKDGTGEENKAKKVTGSFDKDTGTIKLTFEEALKEKTTYYVTLTDKDMSESEKLEVVVNPYVADTHNGIESVTGEIDGATIPANNVSAETDNGEGITTAIHYQFDLFSDEISSLTSVTLKLDSDKSTVSYKANNQALEGDEGYTGETSESPENGSVTIGTLDFESNGYLYVKVTSEAGESLYYLITVNELELEAGDATTPVKIPESLQEALQDANLDETALDETSQTVMDHAIASAIAKNTELTEQMENEGQKDSPEEGTVWKLLKDANADITGETINYYYLPLLALEVQRYDVSNENEKIMLIDITPKYSVIATTANSWENVKIKGQDGVEANQINAVELATGETIELADVTVEIVVPEGFAGDGTTVYVQHGDEEYVDEVESGKVSVTVPHFSVFTLTTKATGKASVKGQVYATVQEAIDAVANQGTVTLTNAATAADLEGLKAPTQLANTNTFTLEKGQSNLEEEVKSVTFESVVKDGKEYSATDSKGTVTVAVADVHKITIKTSGSGSVTVNPNPAKNSTQVTLTVSGTVESLTVTNDYNGEDVSVTPAVSSSEKTYTFTMPDHDVTVTATFKSSSGNNNGGGGSSSSSSSVNTTKPTNGSFTVSDKNAKAGDTVKVTPKANTGYVVDQVTVTDKNGKAVTVKANADGTYSFTMPAKNLQPVTVKVTFKLDDSEKDCPSEKFTDVDQSKWYHEGVDYAIKNGLMNGTGANTFAPDATTTRAMVVTILYRLDGEPAVTKNIPFADVPAGKWYSDAINWAAANGIVDGYGNNKFGPDDTITREQMAAILYRYASYKGYNVSDLANLSGYTDAGKVSTWADTAVRWAVSAGLIEGTSGSTLSPSGSATRAQVATILMRFCEEVVK